MPSDPFAPRQTEKPQLTLEEVKTMHPVDLDQARREGRCRDVLMNGDPERQAGYQYYGRQSNGVQGKDFESIVKAGRG